jgi:hypothetical protein
MPGLIRRGGAYVRYSGSYARDIDLCDCICDGEPPGVCCCDDLPDTLFGRAVMIGHASCSPNVANEQEVFFEVARATCDDMEDIPVVVEEDRCTYGIHCGSFTFQKCTLGGLLFDAVIEVLLLCNKSAVNSTAMSFTLWHRTEVAPGSFLPWGSISSLDHDCPVETIDDWPMPSSPFKELEFWI